MLYIRTYERGVEDETLACGTGALAAALIAIAKGKAVSPVPVKTRSSEVLKVYTSEASPPFKDVCLEGGARVVCEGEITEEAYK
jgi:diaminopimelate epimerase